MIFKSERLLPTALFFIAAVLIIVTAALSGNAKDLAAADMTDRFESRQTAVSEEKTELQTSTTAETEQSVSSESLAGEPEQIILSFAGDCTLGQDEDYFWNTFDTYAERYGYGYFFKKVSGIFLNDDFTFINFEGVLTGSADIQPKEYNFRGPPEYISILKEGGIDGVTLANNHTLDYGLQGYEDTVRLLETNDILYADFEEYFIAEIRGITVAYLGYKGWSHEKRSSQIMKETVKYLREAGTDYIIVNYHWGDELSYTPNEQQKRMAREAIDQGVDLVIGHHPHVIQGREEYMGKTIVYSLGNFCFGGSNKPYDFDTVIFQHIITVLDGKIILTEDRIIPARVSGRPDLNDYQPFIAEGDEAERILDKYVKLPLREELPEN